MIIGIDVGGTHADGVLLQHGQVIAKKKVLVDSVDLRASIIELLRSLLPPSPTDLTRIHLSTTLCTNALVNNNLDEVGMFIQAGPGMNPEFFRCGENTIFLKGAVDHRGQVVRSPEKNEVLDGITQFGEKNIDSIGIVSKFSHRNSEHEEWVRDQLEDTFSHVSMGHRLSGMPNFPRRVYTTWLNSGLKSQFHGFKEAMAHSLADLGITCPVYILKADGGTMPFAKGCEFPCQSIHSGPSASVMGGLALVNNLDMDSILLDIGGTTTDICIFADGVPLLEPYGATVAGRPTLIRALLTRSVGLGGDSSISYDGQYSIGPLKSGVPMAFGGDTATPTDAMVVLGLIQAGSMDKSRKAMQTLRPGEEIEKTASEVLSLFAKRVHENVMEMIDDVFSRPIYTVSEFFERKKLAPERLITIGGPALALKHFLEEVFAIEAEIPEDFEVANAIGAARARVTIEASLYADTGLGRLSIPEMSILEKPGRMFTMMEAQARLEEAIKAMAVTVGADTVPPVEFIERLEMNTVRGFSSTGKIITLKAQIRPGLAPEEG